MLERLRPVEKFDGASKKLDFDDHMSRFERAVNLPGLTAKWKLAEFQEWFSGVARVKISRFLKRDDHDEAFKEAIDALKEAFGEKASTADEMLADLMSGPAIDKKDASAIDMFISRLEESYFLALDTDRDSDFNRISLYKRVLSELCASVLTDVVVGAVAVHIVPEVVTELRNGDNDDGGEDNDEVQKL